jgi:hypothetical protein
MMSGPARAPQYSIVRVFHFPCPCGHAANATPVGIFLEDPALMCK